MADHGSQWLLQVYVLLMLVHPLSLSSHLEGDMGTVGKLPKDMEQQDVGPAKTRLWVVVAVSLASLVLELLVTGIVLGWCLGRRVWRCWGEVREGCHAGRLGARAGMKQVLGPSWCQTRHESPHGREKLGRTQGSWASCAVLSPRPWGRGGCFSSREGTGPCGRDLETSGIAGWKPFSGVAQLGQSLSWGVQRHPKSAQPMLSLCCVLQERCQSLSVSAGPCRCWGCSCCKELLQVLRHKQALMQLCLHHSSLQRPRQRRAAKGSLWKRRRLHFSPQL